MEIALAADGKLPLPLKCRVRNFCSPRGLNPYARLRRYRLSILPQAGILSLLRIDLIIFQPDRLDTMKRSTLLLFVLGLFLTANYGAPAMAADPAFVGVLSLTVEKDAAAKLGLTPEKVAELQAV